MFTGTRNSIPISFVTLPTRILRLSRPAFAAVRLLLALTILTPPASSAPALAPIEIAAKWVHAGELRDITVHKFGRNAYFRLDQLARLSDAQIRWQPVAGQVCLNNANGELCFDWESNAVSLDDRRLRETVAMRFENEQLFVPISFVTSERFGAFSATRLTWNSDRLRLMQDPEVNLRIPQVERTNGIYRLALDVNPQSQPQLIEKNSRRVWLRFGRAISNGSQVLEGDTVIHDVRVTQRRHSADLILNLGDDATAADVYYEDGKRRLVIEVTPSARVRELAMAAGEGSDAAKSVIAAAPASAPKAPAPSRPAKSAKLSIPERSPVISVGGAAAAIVEPKIGPAETPVIKAKPLKTAPLVVRPSRIRTYVIDAGHGGLDSGAIGVRGTLEKDINLSVARELARQLRKVKDVKVIMTRDKDEFIALAQRTAIANHANADLFVSIHCNSALSSKGNGFESYYLAADATDKAAAAVARVENSVVRLEAEKGADRSKLGQLLASMAVYNFMNESSKFASIISKKIRDKSNVEKAAVKEADFFVLRGAQMPSVLLELEYLSNPVSEVRLRSSRYQSQLVRGIVDGILTYDRQHRQEQSAYVSQPGRNNGRIDR